VCVEDRENECDEKIYYFQYRLELAMKIARIERGREMTCELRSMPLNLPEDLRLSIRLRR
jgi:hypothetical protein